MRSRIRYLSSYLLLYLRKELLLCGAQVFKLSRNLKYQNLVISSGIEGSVGDKALLESLLQALNSDTRFVTADRADYEVEMNQVSSIGISMPKIFGIRPISNVKACLKLGAMMSAAENIFLIGADIADGKYSEFFSFALWDTAIVGKVLEKTVTIVGFSWNKNLSHKILEKAALAQEKGVLCRLRDPVSYRRFISNSGKGAVLSADLVFSKEYDLHDSKEYDDIETFITTAKNSAIINVSGYIAESQEWMAAMRSVISFLQSQHYNLVVIPMVFRTGQSDLIAQNLLRERLKDMNLYFVERELSPGQILKIIAKVDFVISGRMHLGIFALKQLKPALVISTQGKVEGLMLSVKRKHWSLENPDELIFRTLELVTNLLNKQNPATHLGESLKVLKSRSHLNYKSIQTMPLDRCKNL